MVETVQPLTDATNQYLASRYKDTTKFQGEAMALPLVKTEAFLFSDELQAASEDAVYNFVLKWARAQYPKLKEQLQNRYDVLRMQYVTVKALLDQGDFNWDEDTCIVTAKDDTWGQLHQGTSRS